MKNDLRIDDLPKQSELIPLLEKEAFNKKLQVFLFRDDELKKYHQPASDNIGVALLAKNKDNANYNIANLRRCYLIQLDK